jgi:DNA-binding LytR/AlgR family response regulator
MNKTNKQKNWQNRLETLLSLIEDLIVLLQKFDTERKVLIVENENEMKCILTDTLLTIKVEDHLCIFLTENGKKVLSTNTLNNITKCLPSYFLKINRNTIVNTRKIDTLLTKERSIEMMSEIPLILDCSETKIPQIKQYLRQNNITIKTK